MLVISDPWWDLEKQFEKKKIVPSRAGHWVQRWWVMAKPGF